MLVAHSFGGRLAQIIAGPGLAAATVAVNPAPFRGVLALPPAAIRSTFPVLANPANRGRAVALSFDQFRYSWANAVDRGHSLTIDSGWENVCDKSLEFIARTAGA